MTNPHSDRRALQRLFDSFSEAALEDPNMAREILEDAGLDADLLAKKGESLARELYSTVRLGIITERRVSAEQKLSGLRERVTADVKALGGDIRAALARLLAGGDATRVEAYFRKFDNLTTEDAVDMLTDAEILRVLEEIDASRDDSDEKRDD